MFRSHSNNSIRKRKGDGDKVGGKGAPERSGGSLE